MAVGRHIVAIDGPSASGKSTVARGVAGALGYLYVDSGSLYRCVAWMALTGGVSVEDAPAVEALARELPISFASTDGAVTFRVGDLRPTRELRTEEVNRAVSPVAAMPGVRKQVVAWLRGMVCFGDLVMEGRDIGTVVFPDAEHKFYLDASPEERARRRFTQDGKGSVEQVGDSLSRRDRIDSTRVTAPLTVAPGAIVVDSTGLSVAGVVDTILSSIGRAGSA